MEFNVLTALCDLGYPGVCDDVPKAIEIGAKSLVFAHLVEWLSKELQALYGLDSCVNCLTDTEDSSLFLLEVSSFLKELNCPFKTLLESSISQRLPDVQSRTTLLDYLCTELKTARLLRCKKGGDFASDEPSKLFQVQNALHTLHITSDFSSDPDACLVEVKKKITYKLESENYRILSPVFNEMLTSQQWDSLASLFEDLHSEYSSRRKLLLTRLDLTLQSFKWGHGSKRKEKEIFEAYSLCRNSLQEESTVSLWDLITARESLLIVEKTSSAKFMKNTKTSVTKHIMPHVPDRGGRPKEQRPPVEMPSWSKRAPGNSQGDWNRGNKRFYGNQGSRKGKQRKSNAYDAAGAY